MPYTTEATYETDVILPHLASLGWQVMHGPDISPGGATPERPDYQTVILAPRLRAALLRINPSATTDAVDQAVQLLLRLSHGNIAAANREFHSWLTDGIDIQTRDATGEIITQKIWPIDTHTTTNNEYLAINQLTIVGTDERRPDVLLYVNGLPLVVLELKNASDEKADIQAAYNQIQTYKQRIPQLFYTNAFNVIDDGLFGRMGSLTANRDRHMAWKTPDGITKEKRGLTTTLLTGVCTPDVLVHYVLNYSIYHQNGEDIAKIIPAYHQYYATEKATERTKQALGEGDKKLGVIWHTQGSGKSLTMAFYAGQLVRQLNNPTIVVVTDRNDLDDQLFGTFSASSGLLRQKPVQVQRRSELTDKLGVAAGGIIFTTLQKFGASEGSSAHDIISDRRNIIVMADEAHRSQYGLEGKMNAAGELKFGNAKYLRDALPNAAFIGFTGTPVELVGKNTYSVFGEEIDTYDITQAVDDNATVPIHYEARLAKIEIAEEKRSELDDEVNAALSDTEETEQESLKSKWARLEALVGSPQRLELMAKDILQHYDARQSVMDGKAMIVCMSRRVAVDLYNQIVKIRPEWHNDNDAEGAIKVVMTGSASDPEEFLPHNRGTAANRELAKRMKKDQTLRIVIVRDMWLTGFDVPQMSTLYVDKPMHGHNLMQAIARVNRVYTNKPSGLVVDYLGIANELKKALQHYSPSDQKNTGIDVAEAIAELNIRMEALDDFFHGFDVHATLQATPSERQHLMLNAMDHVESQDDGEKRFVKLIAEASKLLAISMPSEGAMRHREVVAFYQAVKVALVKVQGREGAQSSDDSNEAIRQILSGALTSNEVIDVFAVAGLDTPEMSILSDEFLADVQGMEQQNLAARVLERVIRDKIKALKRTNLVKAMSFLERLDSSLNQYQNRTLQSAEIMAELIELARQVREEPNRANEMGLNEIELAFYDALANNESAKEAMQDSTLKAMAQELAETIRNSTTIDWTKKEDVRARLRLGIKRLLRKYKYPPDQQEDAINAVLEQAEFTAEQGVD